MVQLRPAQADDSAAIRDLIHQVHINPTGLDWRRFILAVDENGGLLGCGQIKPHWDGTRELASIAVVPAFRGQGIAHQLIDHLIAGDNTLYLTCRASLGTFYQKFGFQAVVDWASLPVYFRLITTVVRLLGSLLRMPEALLVMKREGN
jgi:N-acetylglutamate synthase-like GNAT family acetyltransferase